jgi:hypothetical protein
LKYLLTAALVAAVVVFAAAPPRPARAPLSGSPDPRVLSGAYHIHTTRSDGALDRDGVARAASRAGLKFAIFTDHGDGTRAPAPPEYLHGVLCVDGVEVSTDNGHYVALGIGQSPYPLGGEGDGVAEDVTRLGGFGIAAHPFSRRSELAWTDWSAPLDGLEWVNADSEWRDETRFALGRALFGYLIRPAGALASLLDRPVTALAKWDELAATKRIVALAAHDAHGGLGRENGGTSGRRFHVPSYEATFRSFSLRVKLPSPPSGDAGRDAALLLSAIRDGAVYTVIDAVATPGSLDFHASAGNGTIPMGGAIAPAAASVTFSARADVPANASILLLRNGEVIAWRTGGVLEHDAGEPGSYRVEVMAPRAPGAPQIPWVVSNPIFWFHPAAARPAPAPLRVSSPLRGGDWRTEVSSGSRAIVSPVTAAVVSFSYQLAGGEPQSQFAALVHDLRDLPEFDAIAFKARASHPMRVSTQLRFAQDGLRRWRRSFYVDRIEREVRIPIAKLRPADGAGPMPPSSRATSLLLVIDLTNAVPGSLGDLIVSDVRVEIRSSPSGTGSPTSQGR